VKKARRLGSGDRENRIKDVIQKVVSWRGVLCFSLLLLVLLCMLCGEVVFGRGERGYM
jgi:hypothetical protein